MRTIRLPDSWRSRPVARSYKELDNGGLDVKFERGISRVHAMTMDELLDYIDSNLGGVGRNVRDWRSTREISFLLEAELACKLELAMVSELRDRCQRAGF